MKNYFLNPRNYFFTWAPAKKLFTKSGLLLPIQPLDKDSSQSLEVQRVPRTSEPCSHQEKGCQAVGAGVLHSLSSMFIDSSSQNQALLLSYLSTCKWSSCYIKIYVYICQLEFYLSLLVYCLGRKRVSQKPFQTVSDYCLGNSPKLFQNVSCYLLLRPGKNPE